LTDYSDFDAPKSIEWPRQSSRKSPRRKQVFFLFAAIVVLFIVVRIALSSWIDLLWYESLGYAEVFWKTLGVEWTIFSVFWLATFAILFCSFLALKRLHITDLPDGHTIIVAGQEVQFSVKPVLSFLGMLLSIIVAIVTSATMMGQWSTLALYYYSASESAGRVDPIFGKPLNFFLFTLPAWQVLIDWFLTMAIICTLMAILFLFVTGSSRALGERLMNSSPIPLRGLSITLAFLLLVLGANVYISRFDSIFEPHTIFQGVTYTDAHVTLPGLLLVASMLVVGAIIAAINAVRRPRGRFLIVAVIPAAICYGLMSFVGWYVSNFLVKPNELVREAPYISYNIQMTRQAFGLDRFQQREFPAETTIDAAEPASNQATLQNIRLWDWHALKDTLRQIQEIRTYYDFPDIDIDRYVLDGKLREVMLATRELNVEKLPESSRNWINEKLIYTHGYGITMNSVNGFTPEGLPTLMLSNMPVQSTVPGLSITRPEIYFGEMTDTDVYVKTRQQEFDYPQGQVNSLTSYQGAGGIVLGSFLRRVMIAFARGDQGKLPFSDDIDPQSRLLMRRNIRERISTLAPFLTFDQDPYIVVGEDGRLSWVMDAFTTSDSYPYASHYNMGSQSINYIRNSVKVVVDAYNGITTFYVFDNNDPVLAAYRKIFPTLFKDASAMPAGLRNHVRYPELLIKTQAEVYGLYHMTNPDVFFNREDLWTVATETGSDNNGEQVSMPMQPNFVLMKLPGESDVEFVEILPFTPANRNNLIGWIAGRCDGVNYGTAIVYDFPKTRLVDGPQQIEARIDQNAQLSGQLTLWNQQGSHVRRGGLLVIPTGKALLYAEPIYLQAQESPMPELRLVVLALQDRLAYAPTFQQALASLFGGSVSSLTSTEAPQTTPDVAALGSGVNIRPAFDQNALITQASKDFDDYQRLTAQGKLSEAGQKLDDLKQLLGKLNAHR